MHLNVMIIAARRTARQAGHLIGHLVLVATLLLVVSLILEGASRLMHFGVRPMLPFVTDLGFAPRLPPNFSSVVKFPGRGSFEVCTDSMGLRRADCGVSDATVRTIVAGDSQVLGWGLSFSDTFAAKVSMHFGTSLTQARILAAGGADVESLRSWATDFTKRVPTLHPEIRIVGVNLGNDLDEMYFDRSMGRVQYLKAPFQWLKSQSFFMLDYALAHRIVFGEPWGLPPGANPVLFALDDGERTKLAHATAEAVGKLLKALPPSDHTVVAIFPADYQLDVRQFDKYRKFYSSDSQFGIWREQAPEAARRLNHIESIIRSILAQSGVTTVSVKDILSGSNMDLMIDDASHHLTAKGHELVSKAIVDAIESATVTHFE